MSSFKRLCLLGLCLVWTAMSFGGSSEDGLFQDSGRWYLQLGTTTLGPVLPDQLVVRRSDQQAVSVQSLQARGYTLVSSVTEISPPYYLLRTSSTNSFSIYQALKTDPDYDLVDYDRLAELPSSLATSEDEPDCFSGVIFTEDPTCVERPDGYPNDPSFRFQTNLVLHRVLDAWNLSRGDADVVMAIVDSGVDINDHDLFENIYVNPMEDHNLNGRPDFTPAELGGDLDGVDNDSNGFVDDLAGWNFACENNQPHSFDLSHGTSVASIAAGMGNNCLGISGIAGGRGTNYQVHQPGTYARGVSLMPIRVTQNGSFPISSGVRGLRYAAETGAKVVNMSLGWNEDLEWVRNAIADLLAHHDFVLVCAGGNSDGVHPGLQYPAAYPGIMTVSVCDNEGNAPVTGYRKGPGMNIVAQRSVVADVTNRFNNCGAATSTRGGLDLGDCFSGSSAAAPQVSGVVGLMLSVNPELSRDEVMYILDATAVKTGMQGYYYTCASGYGTLDAFEAVTEVIQRSIPVNLTLNQSLSSGYVGKAYDTITTGSSFLLQSGREATLHAGERIVLGPGTRIAAGSNFRADVGYHETCPTLVQTD